MDPAELSEKLGYQVAAKPQAPFVPPEAILSNRLSRAHGSPGPGTRVEAQQPLVEAAASALKADFQGDAARLSRFAVESRDLPDFLARFVQGARPQGTPRAAEAIATAAANAVDDARSRGASASAP
ncbi:MAG: hypothetical protein IT578_04210 [Verrucomicrobiae bacterium]|nr:hypothetical protein [Verrucomicrobiae bacterium]